MVSDIFYKIVMVIIYQKMVEKLTFITSSHTHTHTSHEDVYNVVTHHSSYKGLKRIRIQQNSAPVGNSFPESNSRVPNLYEG